MWDIESLAIYRWIMSAVGSQSYATLFFYSLREFLLILIQQNHTLGSVWGFFFTCALGTSCSTESEGKLRCGTATELLKQSSADKPCILSQRERARA